MHERIIGLYQDNAAAWDAQRGRDLHEKAWLERFASRVPRTDRVLDLGCGSGEPIARWLIEAGFAVTGVDSSPALIAMCRTRFKEQDWLAADMRELELPQHFGGLIAWHSLFHLSPDDQRAMFPRFAALLRRGGVLMFTSGPEAGEAIGKWQGEALYHASLAAEEYEALLKGNGFCVIEHRLRDPDCGESTLWLARKET
jgi:SAM-dependent methyltransferase